MTDQPPPRDDSSTGKVSHDSTYHANRAERTDLGGPDSPRPTGDVARQQSEAKGGARTEPRPQVAEQAPSADRVPLREPGAPPAGDRRTGADRTGDTHKPLAHSGERPSLGAAIREGKHEAGEALKRVGDAQVAPVHLVLDELKKLGPTAEKAATTAEKLVEGGRRAEERIAERIFDATPTGALSHAPEKVEKVIDQPADQTVDEAVRAVRDVAGMHPLGVAANAGIDAAEAHARGETNRDVAITATESVLQHAPMLNTVEHLEKAEAAHGRGDDADAVSEVVQGGFEFGVEVVQVTVAMEAGVGKGEAPAAGQRADGVKTPLPKGEPRTVVGDAKVDPLGATQQRVGEAKVDPLGATQQRVGDAKVDPLARTESPSPAAPPARDAPTGRPLDGQRIAAPPERLSPQEHAQARQQMQELTRSGHAWDAQGKPTDEYWRLRDTLGGHNDLAVQRLAELSSGPDKVNADNPNAEYHRLQAEVRQHVDDSSDQIRQRQATMAARYEARKGGT